MGAFQIDLEQAEIELLSRLKFDSQQIADHLDNERNGVVALELMQRLAQRRAIPDHRRRYFTDPEFNAAGRGRSWQQVFERNGRRGEEIVKHANFLPYLRYFIFGADLPDSVRSQFRMRVEECGLVTSSDIVPLGKAARELVRRFKLEPSESKEEFYRLALDCGLDAGDAASIRRAVGTIR